VALAYNGLGQLVAKGANGVTTQLHNHQIGFHPQTGAAETPLLIHNDTVLNWERRKVMYDIAVPLGSVRRNTRVASVRAAWR